MSVAVFPLSDQLPETPSLSVRSPLRLIEKDSFGLSSETQVPTRLFGAQPVGWGVGVGIAASDVMAPAPWNLCATSRQRAFAVYGLSGSCTAHVKVKIGRASCRERV